MGECELLGHDSNVCTCCPGNVKALFRRARAHVAVWNPDEAEADLNEALKLDSSLDKVVKKELSTLEQKRKEKDLEDKQMYQGKIFK